MENFRTEYFEDYVQFYIRRTYREIIDDTVDPHQIVNRNLNSDYLKILKDSLV